MKVLLYCIAVCVFMVSCRNTPAKLKPVTAIDIENIFFDTLSIRAIEVWNDTTVWFGSDQGVVGVIGGKKPKLAQLKYNDTLLAFRSIARNSNAVFLLNAGSPAVLYKSHFNGNEAEFMTEVYSENHPAVFYDAMSFSDEMRGVAMGDPTHGCMSVLLTTNGGLSWRKISCEILPKTLQGEAGYAASNSTLVTKDSNIWLASGGSVARVFYSPDFGKSWEVFNTPIVAGQAMQGIYSMDFYDDKHGVIFGGDWNFKTDNMANKAITRDGGKTWQLVNGGSNPGYRSCVQFFPESNAQEIIAVGSEGIDYSFDGGINWKKLSNEGFYTLRFVDTQTAYVAGKGRISKIHFSRE